MVQSLKKIVETEEGWLLYGVEHAGKLRTVEMMKEPLRSDEYTLRDWMKMPLERDFVPSLDLFASVALALKTTARTKQGIQIVEPLRVVFDEDFRSGGFTFATLIGYRPQGLDYVIHDAYTTDRFVGAPILGMDGEFGAGKIVQSSAIFGRENAVKVGDALHWLSGFKPYVLTLDPPIEEIEETGVAIAVDSKQLILNLCADLDDTWRVRGLRIVK